MRKLKYFCHVSVALLTYFVGLELENTQKGQNYKKKKSL